MRTAELSTRRIGVEHEMTIPLVGGGSGRDVQRTLAHVLSSNGIRAIARSYTHEPVPDDADVSVEYDASVRGESRYRGITWFSVELKTRVLSGMHDWERVVPQALAIARYMGARVNGSCGYHVHVDLPEAVEDPNVIRSLYNLIHRFEPVLYGLQPRSRQRNGYARCLPDRTRLMHGCRSWRCFRRALNGWDRHCGLNLSPLLRREGPHVELRYAVGTLNPEKARHWARFAARMVDHAITRRCQAAREQTPNSRKGLEALRYTVGLKSNRGIYPKVAPELKETSHWLLKRWKRLNEDSESGTRSESSESAA